MEFTVVEKISELAKIDPYLYSVELQDGNICRIVKVIIDGKDAYVLLENYKWYLYESDEYIDVIKRPSSSGKVEI